MRIPASSAEPRAGCGRRSACTAPPRRWGESGRFRTRRACGGSGRASRERDGTARHGHAASRCHPGNTAGREIREEAPAPPRPLEPLTCPPRAAPSAHAAVPRRTWSAFPAPQCCAEPAAEGMRGRSGVSVEFLGTLLVVAGGNSSRAMPVAASGVEMVTFSCTGTTPSS